MKIRSDPPGALVSVDQRVVFDQSDEEDGLSTKSG
jgi:hypothetical protein